MKTSRFKKNGLDKWVHYMDETYIKVKGKWVYLYRAVDKEGQTVDFILSEKRDEPAARAFFNKAIGSNGLPEKVTMDKSGANKAGVNTINLALALLCMLGGLPLQMKVNQIKYLNNIIEQYHRFVKKITNGMRGFKAFHSAESTLSGIELHHMLRKKTALSVKRHDYFRTILWTCSISSSRINSFVAYESFCDKTRILTSSE